MTPVKFGRRMIAALAVLIATAAGAAPDQGAIRQIEAEHVRAWNARDARGYAATYADDAQFISAFGHRWSSRAEIERKIPYAFAYGSLTIDNVDIKPLSDILALATVSWTIAGAETRHGIQTQLIGERDGQWRILSSQDTATLAEGSVTRPRAAAPAQPAAAAAPAKPPRRCRLANRNGNCIIYK